MKRLIKIGTRASKLAVIQAEMVAKAIEEGDNTMETELVPMKTTGDIILDRTLDQVGGKGLFVKELDAALLDGRADITVHSCKDMPVELDKRLPLVAVSSREQPEDVLVLPRNADQLDRTKPIGCSSARRRVQLKRLFPEMQVKSVRGNVLTRLEKLDSGDYSALILAAAGLVRLGLEARISRIFTPDEMLPSACQGTLAIQSRIGEDTSFLSGFLDTDNLQCTLAERAFIRALDGGCSKPCAAYAVFEDRGILLRGMYVSDDEQVVIYDSARLDNKTNEAIESQAAALALKMKQAAKRGVYG